MCEAVSAHQNDEKEEEKEQEKKESSNDKQVKWLATAQQQFCQKIESKPKEANMCKLQIRQKNGRDHKWDVLVDTGSSFHINNESRVVGQCDA